MWCDEFDGDLYKLVPQAREAIAGVAHIDLVTYGSVWKDGRLNHPSVWNTDMGSAAWFGLKNGKPFKPAAYFTLEPLVECTFEEACRSGWVQGWVLLILGRPLANFAHPDMREPFNELLFHARGIHKLPEDRVVALQHLVAGQLKFISSMLERTIYYHGGAHADRV